jgi:hypothetical protein
MLGAHWTPPVFSEPGLWESWLSFWSLGGFERYTMFNRFHRWLERKLRVDTYELRGDEIVSTGILRQRVRLQEIQSWRSYFVGGGVLSVEIQLTNGKREDFSDRHEQVYEILHRQAPDRELPFVSA